MNAHPAAELFPLMTETELRELAEDIRVHGLREPVVTLDGLILDGRNRLRACEIAGVAARFEEWDGGGGSPTDFVMSLNLHRRHLTKSQLAFIANEARALYEVEARSNQGTRSDLVGGTSLEKTREVTSAETALRAAESVGVSPDYVYKAARIEREAPDVAEEIRAGRATVGTAIRDLDGTRQTRVYIKDKHAELVKRADSFARLADRWDVSMTDALAPPQARKQLTVLNKAAALLAEAIKAVEYRADTPHTFLGR